MVNSGSKVSRRQFTCGGVASVTLAVAGVAQAVDLSWSGLVGDEAELRRLAALHLGCDPSAKIRIDQLKREITTSRALRRRARASRAADLRDGRVAIVDGWVLARSEADLLAAIAFG